MNARATFVFGIGAVAFWLVWPIALRVWSEITLAMGTVTSSYPWFNQFFLLLWGFCAGVSAFIGALAVYFADTRKPLNYALALGVICGLMAFWASRHHFAEDSPRSVYIWAYGTYFTAPLGAMLGAGLVRLLIRWSPNNAVERAQEE
jgi:hypothetical protein